jgi:hypothetical protein
MTNQSKPKQGWLREVLEDSSRKLAELPGWVFGGLNPFAPDAPPGLKEAALKSYFRDHERSI